MALFTPINARSYYDYLPPAHHGCGDIWISLPSMGLLAGHDHVTGIIITPACDVSNFKTETLTYLPVISVPSYLGTVALLPTIRREVFERYKSANVELEFNWPEKGYEPPTEAALQAELSRLETISATPKISTGKRAHLDRAAAGLRLAIICRAATHVDAQIAYYELLFGKNWAEVKKNIITNAYRNDIHFMPSDDRSGEGLGIEAHSVVLFRYPISVPSEVLTAAQTVSEAAWPDYMKACSDVYPAALHFRERRPIKTLSLKASFLSDLLSRFTALYGRIGSPDFSKQTVEKYMSEIS